MFNSWYVLPKDSYSGRHLTNRLLEYLMERCDHSTRSIFKHNLEIIKTFVEVWKERIEVPTKYVDWRQSSIFLAFNYHKPTNFQTCLLAFCAFQTQKMYDTIFGWVFIEPPK